MSTYTPIQAITVGTAVSSIEFTGIPQTYTDLVLVAAGSTTAPTDIKIRVGNNGIDTTSNYGTTRLYGNGTSPSSDTLPQSFFYTVGSFSDSNNIMQFMSYSNTGVNKTMINRINVPGAFVGTNICTWRSNTAITNIRVYVDSGNISTNATFTLYGIGSGAPKAFGGSEVRTDGTYWYHIFNASGTFTPVQNLTCDYLVIAGGGAGGRQHGGGGGAGGYRTSVGTSGANSAAESALNLLANTAYTVTIGAGGTAIADSNTRGPSGSNSTFATITSTGGGGGGTRGTQVSGGNGGSGGGGGYVGAGGTGTALQGLNGGTDTNGMGAGGGGASTAGSGTTSTKGGNGGSGIASTISGTSVTRAGGGGGGTQGAQGDRGLGTGGGGDGGWNGGNGTSATANTGGGGGGGGNVSTLEAGNGGSGIVIVRYAV